MWRENNFRGADKEVSTGKSWGVGFWQHFDDLKSFGGGFWQRFWQQSRAGSQARHARRAFGSKDSLDSTPV